MGFHFQQGDRPLPGYTVQRGVGKGGFGEVYYATSDGGKEVALKYLRDHPQVELRGATHCLNLKSPYLVALHDIKQSAGGDHFVIMEYINGPSLRDLMNDEPRGLGLQKAAYFLREIGKGLAYLHDRGIVHRDLKPGNIFYEDGYAKIGDYGLSKIMAASQHSGQTISVGTVHYMAPEVGSGNYDRTIDIYALGVMMYEMLLGRVPFSGASMGEVLMKHLTAQPEVDTLPEPFPDVIRKALAKDPKDRYQTVQEMVSALFSVEDLDRSVAAFEPASISTAAARAARDVQVAANPGMAGDGRVGNALGTGSSNIGPLAPPPVIPVIAEENFDVCDEPALHGRLGSRMSAIADRLDRTVVGQGVAQLGVSRTNRIERLILGLVVCAGMSAGLVVLGDYDIRYGFNTFTRCIAVIGGVILGHWLCAERFKIQGSFMPRLIAIVSAGAFISMFEMHDSPFRFGRLFRGGQEMLPIMIALVLCDWPERVRTGRRGEVSVGLAFSIGLFGLISSWILEVPWVPVVTMLATCSLGVQAIAGIWPLKSSLATGGVGAGGGSEGQGADSAEGVAPVAVSRDGRAASPMDAMHGPDSPHATGAAVIARPRLLRGSGTRTLWLICAAALMISTVFSFVAPAVLRFNNDDYGVSMMLGVTLGLGFLFALTNAAQRYRRGLWRGVFRQAICFAGAAVVACSGLAMGWFYPDDEEFLGLLGGIFMGASMMIFVWFVPVAPYDPTTQEADESLERRKGRGLKIAGACSLTAAVVLLPILCVVIPVSDQEEVLPAVLGPLMAGGLVMLIMGFVIGRKPKVKKTPKAKVELPIKRSFYLDSIERLDSLLSRHMSLHNYVMKSKGDLLWTFVRGDWTAQFWQSDVRRWRTHLRIAVYEQPEGGYRVSCHLDLETGFNTPPQAKLRHLNGELAELEQLLGARSETMEVREGVA